VDVADPGGRGLKVEADEVAELARRFSPDLLEAIVRRSPGAGRARALEIGARLGGVVPRVALDLVPENPEASARGQRDSEGLRRRAQDLRDVISGLGPAFVKLGQALSSRPDLLPREYLEELSALQDQLPSFPNPVARALLEEELRRPVGDVFSELGAQPVAAASLGQVYQGRLRSTGERVAVKVQRPGIAAQIVLDMHLIRELLLLVDQVSPLEQKLVPLLDEFAQRLFGELDYRAEGESAEKFEELYGHMPKVRVPGIYWEATARRVLTMEWVDGVKMTDEAAMAEAGLEVVKFVDVGIECTLRQLLEHGYFHADPHPGNLLATKEGELCYLDFGMMSDAPQSARYAIINHVVHLVNRDYLAMCQDYYALDFIDRSVDTRPIAPSLEEFFESGVLGSSVSDLNFKAIIDGLGDVLFAFPFQVPAYYALILRSLTVLEGLALSADREYKVLAKSYPYMAQRLLTDPSPELRTSLEEMLFSQGKFRWSRLESLYTEGSKSQAFDPTALWLLVDYIVSESAGPIRSQLTEEVVRLIDGYCATQAHQNLAAVTSKEVARRLVPISGRDLRNHRRLELLSSNVQGTASKLLRSAVQVPSLDRLPAVQELPSPPSPGEALVAAQTAREQAGSAIAQIREIAQKPGSGEVVNGVSGGLARKVAARTIKGINGAMRQAGVDATQA